MKHAPFEIKCGVAICGKCGHCMPSGGECDSCKAQKRAEKLCRDIEKAHKDAGKSKLKFP